MIAIRSENNTGKIPVSVFIIAKNEADRIGACIDAVSSLVSEVVVIDSGSKDDTVSVAIDHGARVIFNAWPGFGLQKRFGEDQCLKDWILNIDADEIVSPELRNELKLLLSSDAPKHAAYRVHIAEMFPGELKPHRWAYSLSPVRLYKKTAGRYSKSPVHDRVDVNPDVTIGLLRHRIHHASIRSLSHQIEKLNSYTDMQVADLAARGRNLSKWRIFTEFPMAFFKVYFLRKHFLRGFYGVATASTLAFIRHIRIAKHLERRKLDQEHQAGRKNSSL
ncbi:MAG: glycosyltransferase family 2 protein [Cohaesibacteraceae bacterium]|nr:glycosyltransferase family 2 protein [Cohaesibacteraceae bacterium]